MDAVTQSSSGLPWEAGAHNMVTVHGHERRGGDVGGLTALYRQGGVTWMQVAVTELFRFRDELGGTRTMLDDWR